MILAIDQGTTGTTCIVFDLEGREKGRAYREFEQHFPQPGWVEHDAEEIWQSVRTVGSEALAAAGIGGEDLAGVGITNQRETIVAWDPTTGEPLHRALVWQDRRTALRCDELRAQPGVEEMIRSKTGLVIDPYFSGTKIEWLLGNIPEARQAIFGTIDSYLIFRLTGRHATDYSNASRTMLFDIEALRWDPDLCSMLGVDPASMPEALPSSSEFGVTSEFGAEVPVCGVAGDQQAALFGQACLQPGEAKNTYGTGSFVLLNAGSSTPDPGEGLIATIAWGIGDEVTYALEASVFVTGAAIQWLRDGLGLIESASETEAMAASLEGNDDVYFVPALTGLGSPYWDPRARGTIVGLTRGTTRANLARAALEGIAYQVTEAVRAQENASGIELPSLKADGGAVANGWLMQFQADVLGSPVVVSEVAETTALGAAYLAGIQAGIWDLEQVSSLWRAAATYEPDMSSEERDRLLGRWSDAVSRSRDWAVDGESGGAT